jgi:hypothetical protein
VSANTTSNPKGPARLGPYLSCHRASILRSNQMSPGATSNSPPKTPTTIQICGNRFMRFYWLFFALLLFTVTHSAVR